MYIVLTNFRNVSLLVLYHRNIDYCSHLSVLAAVYLIDLVGGAMYFA